MEREAAVKALYYVMQSVEGRLGGGEGVEGLYGSIKRTGMQKVLDCLAQQCSMDSSSCLVDIGAGLGRPLLHALVGHGIASAFGIEIDSIKVEKAVAFLRQTVREVQKRGAASEKLAPPEVICSSIEEVPSLSDATHAYSFWEGVPPDAKYAFGRLFAASKKLKAVAVVQRSMRQEDPAEFMADLGFGPVVLVDSFPVSMSGSGRNFMAYIFNKAGLPARLTAPAEPAAATPAAATPAVMATPALQLPPKVPITAGNRRRRLPSVPPPTLPLLQEMKCTPPSLFHLMRPTPLGAEGEAAVQATPG
ncbi:hypothetical protein WJX72_006653 [[Myrmecia] bisecta]|uniref:DOT1 domain-containing protein n=1 Tax=[Myrmecia] bisecta TaxID=41462 RepID=A0AAW1R7I8_9CHLO